MNSAHTLLGAAGVADSRIRHNGRININAFTIAKFLRTSLDAKTNLPSRCGAGSAGRCRLNCRAALVEM